MFENVVGTRLHGLFLADRYAAAMTTTLSDDTTFEILRRHGLNVYDPAQSHVPPGARERVDAAIAGSIDPELGRTISLVVRNHSSRRMCPLTEFEAETMIAELRGTGAIPNDERFARMLIHVISQTAKIFDRYEGNELLLAPIAMWEGGYVVEGARLTLEHPLHVHPRVAPDSHDRRAQYAHRRTDTR